MAVAAALVVLAAGPVRADDHEHTRRGNAEQQRSGGRGPSGERAVPRGDSRPEGRVDGRRHDDREYNRPRTEIVVPHRDNRVIVRPQYRGYEAPRYRSYGYYGPAYRPYVFRPRVRVGFGLFLGYPVPYSYSYPYPVRIYGYGAPGYPVVVGPSQSIYGGVALEITPDDAEVFVDGAYAGIVRDFDGTRQPLTLAAGTHRLEIRLDGYEPTMFDVTVQPGQVIPYQGDLRPY
jgi:hypothetical protein